MAVARIGLRGQIGDPPRSTWVAQQNAQDGCRLRGEDGAQRAGLGAGLVCDGALDVDSAECEPCIADQIDVGDIVVGADGARLRRQVRADKNWNEAPAAKCFTGPAQSRHAALELMDPRTDKPGGSVRIHVDDERIGSTGVAQTDQCIDTVDGADPSFTLHRFDLHVRHVAEQVANRIHGADVSLFHQLDWFQHLMNIEETVKRTRITVLERSDMAPESKATLSSKHAVEPE